MAYGCNYMAYVVRQEFWQKEPEIKLIKKSEFREGEVMYDSQLEAEKSLGRPLNDEDIVFSYDSSTETIRVCHDKWNGRDSDELCGRNEYWSEERITSHYLFACYKGEAISIKIDFSLPTKRNLVLTENSTVHYLEDDKTVMLYKDLASPNKWLTNDDDYKIYLKVIDIIYDAFGL